MSEEAKSTHHEQLQLVETQDGSSTLYHPEIGEHYHSRHGALQEARHVFLSSGLKYFLSESAQRQANQVSVLEMGFGTGLNFFLTADFCQKNELELHYSSIEKYPLPAGLIERTGNLSLLEVDQEQLFLNQYQKATQSRMQTQLISLQGVNLSLFTGPAEHFRSTQRFDVLYFDAFSAIHQPEMWERELLEPLCTLLKPGGIFVTYAITGNLKRLMKSLGFQIQKIPGAPGKREMLRAVRQAP